MQKKVLELQDIFCPKKSIQNNIFNTKFESYGNTFFCMLGKDKGGSFVLPIVEHKDQTDCRDSRHLMTSNFNLYRRLGLKLLLPILKESNLLLTKKYYYVLQIS